MFANAFFLLNGDDKERDYRSLYIFVVATERNERL